MQFLLYAHLYPRIVIVLNKLALCLTNRQDGLASMNNRYKITEEKDTINNDKNILHILLSILYSTIIQVLIYNNNKV